MTDQNGRLATDDYGSRRLSRESHLRKVARRRLFVALALTVLLLVVAVMVVFFNLNRDGSKTVVTLTSAVVVTTLPLTGSSSTKPSSTKPSSTRLVPNTLPPTPVFDRRAYSIDDPNSIWVVVDKLRPLQPQSYEPLDLEVVPVPHTWEPSLRKEAAAAVVTMFTEAKNVAGLTLASNSAYRSYDSQVQVYDGNDSLTARPGFSEHQTGLAIDIGAKSGNCSLAVCFADQPEGLWLKDNAYRFGFILRYPSDKTAITGYDFEPWHFRYIGVTLAAEMHNNEVTTLEEFFGLPAAPNYA